MLLPTYFTSLGVLPKQRLIRIVGVCRINMTVHPFLFYELLQCFGQRLPDNASLLMFYGFPLQSCFQLLRPFKDQLNSEPIDSKRKPRWAHRGLVFSVFLFQCKERTVIFFYRFTCRHCSGVISPDCRFIQFVSESKLPFATVNNFFFLALITHKIPQLPYYLIHA